MVNYAYGKIYKITSESTGLTYYGSTSEKYLSQRLATHIDYYKRYLKGNHHYITAFELLKQEDYKIELIKNYPSVNKTQLTTEEAKYIRENNCVNRNIPCRTKKEYYQDNKKKIKEYSDAYREQNGEKIKEQNKKSREKNKEKIKERKSKNYECACGSIVRWNDKTRHFRSTKHCQHIKNNL